MRRGNEREDERRYSIPTIFFCAKENVVAEPKSMSLTDPVVLIMTFCPENE